MISLDKKYRIAGVIFVLLASSFAMISYLYSDIQLTQWHGIQMWNALFAGKINHVYEYYAAEGTIAAYDFTVYLIFAIWNFPCWVFEKISGTNAQDFALFLLWGKMMIFAFVAATTYLMGKIYSCLQPDTDRNDVICVCLYYASSLLLTAYSLYTGNYDVIELLFILMGVHALLKGKFWLFVLFFSIAVSGKGFALWIYIPILLVRQKNVWRILISILAGMGITVIERLIFGNNEVLVQLGSEFSTTGLLSSLIESNAVDFSGIGTVSILIILYVILCVYCYTIDSNSDSFIKYQYIYIITCAWMIYFMFYPFNTYWIVLLVPFLILIVFEKSKKIGFNIILECIFSMAIFLAGSIRQHWVIGGNNDLNSYRFFEQLFSSIGLVTYKLTPLSNQLANYSKEKVNLFILFNSIFMALGIVFLVVNRPKSKVIFECSEKTTKQLYIFRILLQVFTLCISGMYYVIMMLEYNL